MVKYSDKSRVKKDWFEKYPKFRSSFLIKKCPKAKSNRLEKITTCSFVSKGKTEHKNEFLTRY
jgi:hypothetical protein